MLTASTHHALRGCATDHSIFTSRKSLNAQTPWFLRTSNIDADDHGRGGIALYPDRLWLGLESDTFPSFGDMFLPAGCIPHSQMCIVTVSAVVMHARFVRYLGEVEQQTCLPRPSCSFPGRSYAPLDYFSVFPSLQHHSFPILLFIAPSEP